MKRILKRKRISWLTDKAKVQYDKRNVKISRNKEENYDLLFNYYDFVCSDQFVLLF